MDKLMRQFNDGITVQELDQNVTNAASDIHVCGPTSKCPAAIHAKPPIFEGGKGGTLARSEQAAPAAFDPQHVNQRLSQCISALQDASPQIRRNALEEIAVGSTFAMQIGRCIDALRCMRRAASAGPNMFIQHVCTFFGVVRRVECSPSARRHAVMGS
eukprot:366029-Chlamydomonas_euryale.AAC.13